jgi:hypothetical protein
MSYQWMPVNGKFDIKGGHLSFRGEPIQYKDASGNDFTGNSVGIAICDVQFTGGELAAHVRFKEVRPISECQLIFYWDPAGQAYLAAGISIPGMFSVTSWYGQKREILAFGGDRRNLSPGQNYALRVIVHGSRVRLFVNDVEVLSTILRSTLPPSQPGILCFDQTDITISNFRADARKGRVFVAIQLSSPYREIYEDVVKKICEARYAVRNAEEIYGPGPIMADVLQDILESEFVVADVTPANPNVYYEVGVADALGKPVILVADRAQRQILPFDIAPNRTIYYENTIAGKKKFEEDFRKSIAALEQRLARPGNTSGAPAAGIQPLTRV